MITKIIRKLILICNRTNKKLPGRKSCSGLVTGNFENSKLFEGLVILNKKKKQEPHNHTHKFHFDLLLSFLSSCLLIFIVFHLVFRVAFSCLSSFISSSLSLFLSLSLSVHFVCLSVSVCCGVCVCLRCVVCVVCRVCGVYVCVVVCGAAWHAEKTSVCRFKTSPCEPAPRAHVLPHAGVVPVHTGTF